MYSEYKRFKVASEAFGRDAGENSHPPTMKTIARFTTLEEAQIAKLTLGAAGIEAFIPDEMSAGVAPMFFVNKPGVRLQVFEENEAAAQTILEVEIEDAEKPS